MRTAIGMWSTTAIVVLEHIERWMEKGAAVRGSHHSKRWVKSPGPFGENHGAQLGLLPSAFLDTA